jgi:hypothetical protein
VTRKTRSGAVLGPEHRVPVITALKAMTIWPAWQHFEEKTKGSIEVGKLADFVILSDNPLTIAQEKLAEIKVLETIKEDKTIYQRSENVAAISSPAMFGVTLNEPHNIENAAANVSHMHIQGDGCFNEGFSLLYRAINGDID